METFLTIETCIKGFVTRVNRDHDIMHFGGDDQGDRIDLGSMAYKERLKRPPLSNYDPDISDSLWTLTEVKCGGPQSILLRGQPKETKV